MKKQFFGALALSCIYTSSYYAMESNYPLSIQEIALNNMQEELEGKPQQESPSLRVLVRSLSKKNQKIMSLKAQKEIEKYERQKKEEKLADSNLELTGSFNHWQTAGDAKKNVTSLHALLNTITSNESLKEADSLASSLTLNKTIEQTLEKAHEKEIFITFKTKNNKPLEGIHKKFKKYTFVEEALHLRLLAQILEYYQTWYINSLHAIPLYGDKYFQEIHTIFEKLIQLAYTKAEWYRLIRPITHAYSNFTMLTSEELKSMKLKDSDTRKEVRRKALQLFAELFEKVGFIAKQKINYFNSINISEKITQEELQAKNLLCFVQQQVYANTVANLKKLIPGIIDQLNRTLSSAMIRRDSYSNPLPLASEKELSKTLIIAGKIKNNSMLRKSFSVGTLDSNLNYLEEIETLKHIVKQQDRQERINKNSKKFSQHELKIKKSNDQNYSYSDYIKIKKVRKKDLTPIASVKPSSTNDLIEQPAEKQEEFKKIIRERKNTLAQEKQEEKVKTDLEKLTQNT